MSICDSVTLSVLTESGHDHLGDGERFYSVFVEKSLSREVQDWEAKKYFSRDTYGSLDTASRDVCIQAHIGCTTSRETITFLLLLDTLGSSDELGKRSLK